MEARGPIRVLVVDDEKPLQELLKCSLEAFGLQVAGVANNGREALEEYERLQPDAVVMDIRMPQMDGITALTRLKADHPEAVVLMITANQEEAQRQEALKLGASGFLHKPFRVDELFADIQRAFRSFLARKSDQPLDENYVRYVLKQPTVRPAAAAAAASAAAPEPQPTVASPKTPTASTEVEALARLETENRELRDQVRFARDTCAKLLETLERTLGKLEK